MPSDVPTIVFREWGKTNGFRRKGTTLYRDQDETVAVVNLQGARYGGRYYLNVALWLKSVGEEPFPKEHHCQLRTRLADLRPAPEDDERNERFLDSTSHLSDDERRSQFLEVLDSVVAPALSATSTLDDLKANPALVRRFLVNRDAYRLLGLLGIGMGS